MDAILDGEYVLHTAAMLHYGNGRATAESIRHATYNTFAKAEELDWESLVIPVLETGAAGYGFEDGARVLRDTIEEYESFALSDVRVIAYTDEYERLQQVATRD